MILPLWHHLLSWLGQSLTLGHITEFACIAKTLSFLKTISALLGLHLLDINFPYLDFLLNFQLDSNLKFFVDFFKLAFMHMSHLLTNDPSSMLFEHL